LETEPLITHSKDTMSNTFPQITNVNFNQQSNKINKIEPSIIDTDLPIDLDEKQSSNPSVATIQPTAIKKELYIVKKGDSLFKISKKNNTTVAALKLKNSLKTDALSIDQILLIP
jgi:LysM repeat protein